VNIRECYTMLRHEGWVLTPCIPASGVLTTGSTVNTITINVISGSSGDQFLVSIYCAGPSVHSLS
jgi:hypothetical protein